MVLGEKWTRKVTVGITYREKTLEVASSNLAAPKTPCTKCRVFFIGQFDVLL